MEQDLIWILFKVDCVGVGIVAQGRPPLITWYKFFPAHVLCQCYKQFDDNRKLHAGILVTYDLLVTYEGPKIFAFVQ